MKVLGFLKSVNSFGIVKGEAFFSIFFIVRVRYVKCSNLVRKGLKMRSEERKMNVMKINVKLSVFFRGGQ